MTKDETIRYLKELNDELHSMEIKGELCLYGGAVMSLAYDARPDTKDVDAIFKPAQQIREAAARIARKHDLRPDWLNDGVKGFLVPHKQRILAEFPNLRVFIPEPDYLLAMKAISARTNTLDAADVKFLIGLLELKSVDDVLTLVENYYPRNQIKPATQFFIEELFGK
ncbi:MAG: hypothetical protein ACXW18_08695 [Pyrinomonadaceae bacterium]